MPRDTSFVAREEDQHYGRVIRNLGNMHLLVYCNDNKQRICKIRGAIRKRTWIKLGDIILVSYREFQIGVAVKSGGEKGDVLHKYEMSDYGRLRRDPTINLALFTTIETQDLTKISIAKVALAVQEEGYIFESVDNEIVAGKSSGADDDWFEDVDEEGAAAGAGAGANRRPIKGSATAKPADDDDIDIDNI